MRLYNSILVFFLQIVLNAIDKLVNKVVYMCATLAGTDCINKAYVLGIAISQANDYLPAVVVSTSIQEPRFLLLFTTP